MSLIFLPILAALTVVARDLTAEVEVIFVVICVCVCVCVCLVVVFLALLLDAFLPVSDPFIKGTLCALEGQLSASFSRYDSCYSPCTVFQKSERSSKHLRNLHCRRFVDGNIFLPNILYKKKQLSFVMLKHYKVS